MILAPPTRCLRASAPCSRTLASRWRQSPRQRHPPECRRAARKAIRWRIPRRTGGLGLTTESGAVREDVAVSVLCVRALAPPGHRLRALWPTAPRRRTSWLPRRRRRTHCLLALTDPSQAGGEQYADTRAARSDHDCSTAASASSPMRGGDVVTSCPHEEARGRGAVGFLVDRGRASRRASPTADAGPVRSCRRAFQRMPRARRPLIGGARRWLRR